MTEPTKPDYSKVPMVEAPVVACDSPGHLAEIAEAEAEVSHAEAVLARLETTAGVETESTTHAE